MSFVNEIGGSVTSRTNYRESQAEEGLSRHDNFLGDEDTAQ